MKLMKKVKERKKIQKKKKWKQKKEKKRKRRRKKLRLKKRPRSLRLEKKKLIWITKICFPLCKLDMILKKRIYVY